MGYVHWISKTSTPLTFRAILHSMSDTAHDYQTNVSANTEGLEDFFEAEVVPGTTEGYQVGPTDGIPVKEAAKILGLSMKTIKDRLRKGTLSGYKVQEKFGAKWMVQLGTEYQVLPGAAEISSTYPTGSTESVAGLLSLVESKDRELQAAIFRNGYLEAQLAERNEHLKLLPDLEKKAKESELLQQQFFFQQCSDIHPKRWIGKTNSRLTNPPTFSKLILSAF